jgi:FixJ family two-component response regulator
MMAVVDDDIVIREALCAAIEFEGLEVRNYATAESALADFMLTGCPRLVVSDIVLGPGLNGFEFGAALKRLCTEVSIIYITAFSLNSGSRQIGPSELLIFKPFGLSEFTEIVKRLYDPT